MGIVYGVNTDAGILYMGDGTETVESAASLYLNGGYINSYGTNIIDLFISKYGNNNLQIGQRITLDNGNYLEISYIFNANNANCTAYKSDGTLLGGLPQIGYKNNNVDTPNSSTFILYNKKYAVTRAVCPPNWSSNSRFTASVWYTLGEFITFGGGTAQSGEYYYGTSAWYDIKSLLDGATISETTVFPGTDSNTGGGGGNFDISSDSVNFPHLPSSYAVNSGMLSIYNVTAVQLRDFSAFLWGGTLYSSITKMFASPMDAVVGLNAFALGLPSGNSQNIFIGYVDSHVQAIKMNSQMISVNCGQINLSEFWGSAFDYAPYTKIELYLPYVSIINLNVDDVMNSIIEIQYNIDVLTGEGIAMIKITRDNLDGILYTYPCNVACKIPISSYDMTAIIKNGLTTLAAAAGAYATGAGAATAVGVGSAINTLTTKPSINRGGSITGNTGILSPLKPYVIITRPIQSVPQAYANFTGYPLNISTKLSSIHGFTVISEIHLENMGAQITDGEITEIENLLKKGVIL